MLAFTDWLLLDISAISVVIVICDMPRQEFSLPEYVYIHNILRIWKAESCVLKHYANFEKKVSRTTSA